MKIMFNHRYGLHDATVQGTKTKTRRIIPKKKIEAYYKSRDNVSYVCLPTCQPIYSETLEQAMMRQCPYEVGQVLPIAECYAEIYNRLLLHGKTNDALAFRSELGAEPELQAGWQNKMFVREELMPRAIRIDAIRFQMLQEISEEDCLAEGIVDEGEVRGEYRYGFYTGSTFGARGNRTTSVWYNNPRKAYAALIDKIGKRGDWDSNPYVYALTYTRIR